MILIINVKNAIVIEFYHIFFHYVKFFSLLSADVAVATPLISMGAILGKVTYMQLIFMGIVELIMFTINKYIGEQLFMVSLSLMSTIRNYLEKYIAFFVEILFLAFINIIFFGKNIIYPKKNK